MILKQRDDRVADDRRRAAGARAEDQMAFYLQRAFGNDGDIHVLNGIRLVDPGQPNPDGTAGAAQIDHLVLHRWGVFIVESKSVTGAVEIRDDGSGGDEWVRVYGWQRKGFQSPLRQAQLQGDFLRALLRPHAEELKQKKMLLGLIQGGFRHLPVQVIVAISDSGRIDRKGKWQPRSQPFQDYVCKADQVAEKIREEWKRHKKASGPLAPRDGDYGLWSIDAADLQRTMEFLLSRHQPLREPPAADVTAPSAPPARGRERNQGTLPEDRAPGAVPAPGAEPAPFPEAACKHCGGRDLAAKWGKYGYYWVCGACGKNTSMPALCRACGAEGKYGKGVRIRKDGERYERVCECGATELVWQQ